MEEKRYSLDDIFSILREATGVLTKDVTIVSEDEAGKEERTPMTLAEAIAMMVGHEMTWDMSRLTDSSGKTMATKDEVVAAMKNNGYDEVGYPVYESFGISMRGGRRTSRRNRRH
jgi:hypothetical protein